MKLTSFGLDIGTSSIKAVWLGKENNGLLLESTGSVPSDQKFVLSEAYSDQQLVALSIKNMFVNAGINITDVNISLPQSQTYMKIIEMPDLSEQELAASLKWEMEQHIPLPLEQVRTDSQVLERREVGDRKVINVLLVAAPIKIIEKYEKLFEMMNLIPCAIETEILSIHRALLPILSVGSDLIIHIGASTTDILITRNKILNMVFSIPLGGVAITRAISVDLGIDLNQAENYKRVYGLNQEIFEGKIGKSLAPVLASIVNDIRKAVLLYKEKNAAENLNQIILSGGSALLPGIDVYFANNLETQVVIGNCWQANGIGNVPGELIEEGPTYNVVVGLALRELT